jgi:hypothetical protein
VDYDYRGARDWIYGLVRGEDGRVIDVPTCATIRERALLLALVEFAPNIEPSTLRLAHMLGLGTFEKPDEKAVRRLLQSCQAKGLLRVEHRTGRRSVYTLTLNPGHSAPPLSNEPRAQCPPTPGDMPSPPRAPRPPKQTSKADKKADKDLEPLRLEAPAAPSVRKSKPAKPPKAEPERSSAHRQVVAHYFDAFKGKHARSPIFGSREGNDVATLLQKLQGDAPEACRRISNAFAGFRSATVTISDIASKPDAFASADAPRFGPRRPPVQQTGVNVDALFEGAQVIR